MNPSMVHRSMLLVEDDPTTRSYLEALLTTLPVRVSAAANMAQALQLAGTTAFDLLLVDARLPDGSGIELLAELRARGVQAPALAHTAARERGELDPLIAAGFEEVLLKPVHAALWTATLAHHLGVAPVATTRVRIAEEPCGKLPVWDDAAATRALAGNDAHVASLRQLFLAELPGQLQALRAEGGTVRDQLHRLRASCALVGAARLDAAVRVLQVEEDTDALQRVLAAGQDTLDQAPSSSSAG
jgi:CheY-like chemotaxis protein